MPRIAFGESARSTVWPPAASAVADDASVLDAVGAREDEGQRQVLDRLRGVVAGKGGDMHGLADAVDAALGPGVDVERAGRRTPGDAAVGEVEPGARHVEEDEILAVGVGHKHGGNHAAGAAGQAGREGGAAFRVGLGGSENLVVAGKRASGRRLSIGSAEPSERAKTLRPSWPV